MKRPSSAFTLVELLVVIAVISILVALMIPAIMAAREASRASQCMNNMRSLGLAMLGYEAATRELPPSQTPAISYREIYHPSREMNGISWMPSILPHAEYDHVSDQIDMKKNWDDPENQNAAKQTIKLLICPTVPIPLEQRILRLESISGGIHSYGSTDYTSQGRIIGRLPGFSHRPFDSAISDLGPTPLQRITDGTSNTLLLIEDAGRPDTRTSDGRSIIVPSDNVDGRAIFSEPMGRFVLPAGAWLHPKLHALHDSTHRYYRNPLNAANNGEAFSFHSGGLFSVFVDGRVEFLSEDISYAVYYSMITRGGGDLSTTYESALAR